jgi:hypothetical protein
VAKFKVRRQALLDLIRDPRAQDEDREAAREKLQKLPRDASPTDRSSSDARTVDGSAGEALWHASSSLSRVSMPGLMSRPSETQRKQALYPSLDDLKQGSADVDNSLARYHLSLQHTLTSTARKTAVDGARTPTPIESAQEDARVLAGGAASPTHAVIGERMSPGVNERPPRIAFGDLSPGSVASDPGDERDTFIFQVPVTPSTGPGSSSSSPRRQFSRTSQGSVPSSSPMSRSTSRDDMPPPFSPGTRSTCARRFSPVPLRAPCRNDAFICASSVFCQGAYGELNARHAQSWGEREARR